MTTAIHGYLLWIPGTTNADTVLNALAEQLDIEVGLRVLSRTTTAEPGTPSEGDLYIIPASATGTDWATYDEGDIAYYRDSAWTSYAPKGSQFAYVVDDDNVVMWTGSAWQAWTSSLTAYPGANEQTGTSYTLVANDAGFVIEMNNAAANTLNIPDNSSVAFPIRTRIDVIQTGAGETSVAVPGSDILLGDPKCRGQYTAISLYKKDSTTWIALGGKA